MYQIASVTPITTYDQMVVSETFWLAIFYLEDLIRNGMIKCDINMSRQVINYRRGLHVGNLTELT